VQRKIKESLRKNFQNKIDQRIDAALQHSYISAQPKSAFSGAAAWWGSKPK
jgi:hypothetical protein